PPELGLAQDRVVLHQGYRGPQHQYVELRLDLPPSAGDGLGLTRRALAARRAGLATAVYLVHAVPAFRGAWLATMACEAASTGSAPAPNGTPAWAQGLEDVEVHLPDGARTALA